MNKEMKRSFRIFLLKILAVVFVLCMCYFLYAFVYRAKTELPTKAVVTNRGAAVYTLRGQKQMLSQKEAFSYFAFDGRERIWNLCHSRTEKYKDVAYGKRCDTGHVYVHDSSGTGSYR